MNQTEASSTKKEKTKEKTIMMEELNQNFKYEVAQEHGGENIKQCFACGTCSATCPVFGVNEKYNPRKIIRMVLLGMEDEVLKSDFIWLCSGCYSCYERCPRDVKITNLMNAIKNLAVKKGFLPKAMGAGVDILEKNGRLVEISEFENSIRLKKEIPELIPILPNVHTLLKKTKIRNIVNGGGSHE